MIVQIKQIVLPVIWRALLLHILVASITLAAILIGNSVSQYWVELDRIPVYVAISLIMTLGAANIVSSKILELFPLNRWENYGTDIPTKTRASLSITWHIFTTAIVFFGWVIIWVAWPDSARLIVLTSAGSAAIAIPRMRKLFAEQVFGKTPDPMPT